MMTKQLSTLLSDREVEDDTKSAHMMVNDMISSFVESCLTDMNGFIEKSHTFVVSKIMGLRQKK